MFSFLSTISSHWFPEGRDLTYVLGMPITRVLAILVSPPGASYSAGLLISGLTDRRCCKLQTIGHYSRRCLTVSSTTLVAERPAVFAVVGLWEID